MSTTMLDAYDAQMLDYHTSDLDVQMNTAISSESWVQEEAAMEDEGAHSVHKGAFEDISIEVDMEDYDGNVTEYDMFKDVRGVSEEGGITDLVDVELYDASRVHSPAVVPQPLPAEAHEVPVATESQQVQLSHQVGEDNDIGTSAEIHTNDHESLLVPPEKVLHDSSQTTEEHHTEIPAISDIDRKDPAVTGNDHTEKDISAAADTQSVTTVTSTTETHLQQSDGGKFPNSEARRDLAKVGEKHAPTDDVVGVSQDDKPEVDHVQGDSAQDPHEISEGVYIDPPPPVYLTIDTADHYNVILFNDVSEDGEHEPGSSPSIVLLENRPTLYYETLPSLFDALRQDTYLSNIPEVSEGELVLDAYDLQLVMAEDNCFARGISLHDVNILHDSYGLVGPLRLRLRLEPSRFIIRYQRLQDRTAQVLAVESHVESHQLNTQNLNTQSPQDESSHEHQKHEDYATKVEDTTHYASGGSANNQVPPLEYEEKQDGDEDHNNLKSSQQEGTISEDSHQSEWLNNNPGLEYIETTETGAGFTATESGVYEASDTDKREGEIGDSVDVVEHAPAEDISEASSSGDDQEYSTEESTPRVLSDRAAEVKAEQAVATTSDDPIKEVAGPGGVTQNVGLATEEPESSVARTANDVHKPFSPDLAGRHEDTLNEDENELVGNFNGASSESWDAEYDEEQEQDGEWEYELDQNQEDRDEQDGQDSTSVESSATLSSRLSSKRSFHELDDDYEPLNYSPGPKKPRVE